MFSLYRCVYWTVQVFVNPIKYKYFYVSKAIIAFGRD